MLSFEFDQICLAELPEESAPWYLFCMEWRIEIAADIIIGSRTLKVLTWEPDNSNLPNGERPNPNWSRQ
jgi:hypothetical protein